jgi:hypothetical protein
MATVSVIAASLALLVIWPPVRAGLAALRIDQDLRRNVMP